MSIDNYTRKTVYDDSWIKQSLVDTNNSENFDGVSDNVERAFKLLNSQRLMQNYAKIITEKDVDVKYHTPGSRGGQPQTDDKVIVIPADVDVKNFDANVGRVLHEACRSTFTNFKIFDSIAGLSQYSPRNARFTLSSMALNIDDSSLHRVSSIINNAADYDAGEIVVSLQSIFSYIETMRIDSEIFKKSPGYKHFYHAFIKSLSTDDIISKAVLSSNFRTESWPSYTFFITNILNKSVIGTELALLPIITPLVNGQGILQLKSTEDSLIVTCKIIALIYDHFSKLSKEATSTSPNSNSTSDTDQPDQLPNDGGSSNNDVNKSSADKSSNDKSSNDKSSNESRIDKKNKPSHDSNDSNDDDSNESDNSKNSDNTENVDDIGASDDTTSGSDGLTTNTAADASSTSTNSSNSETAPLSATERFQLENTLSTLSKFYSNSLEAKPIKKAQQNVIRRLSQLDVSQPFSKYNATCLNIKLTDSLLESQLIQGINSYEDRRTVAIINDSIRQGKRLATKLQVLNDDRSLKFNRQSKGRIDQRRLHAVAYDDFNVFYNNTLTTHKKSRIHLSIDASSSMSGSWANVQSFVIKLSQAFADLRDKIELVLSYRYTCDTINNACANVIVYDSKVHSIKHLLKYIPQIRCSGNTPEGFCYTGLLNDKNSTWIDLTNNPTVNNYFITLTDGEPTGMAAMTRNNNVQEAQAFIKQIKSAGYIPLAFFLKAGGGSAPDAFWSAYGSHGVVIDTANIRELSTTLNDMFIAKSVQS